MKIPHIWLKDYVDTDKSLKEIAASFTQLGLMLDKPLDATHVLDLEHRMDRSDWLSIIGCARDFAAFEGIPLKLPKLSLKTGKAPTKDSQITIKIESPDVRRFKTKVFKNIKVADSPQWLQDRLIAYGMTPINNIVDITNFVMVEYGQPMHAQDIAKLKGSDLTIRNAKKGETLTTLLGTEVSLDPDTFVVTSGGEVTVIGGIVGGKNTGVTKDTRDIILDSGNYDSRIVRKNSRRLKIINESVMRYDKFLSPLNIDAALARATMLIEELAGGEHFENGDYFSHAPLVTPIQLRQSRLKLLSGMDISLPVVKKILKSLEYKLVEEGEGTLTLEIPHFRTDIEVEDDLVSDILRIHNYSNIKDIAISSPVPPDITPQIYRFEDRLRDILIAQGAHEHITSSLSQAHNQIGQVILSNALSTDQNALRTELTTGLNHVITTYSKHRIKNVPVFEIGKVFAKSDEHYLEGRLLTLVSDETSVITGSLASLMKSLGITNYQINNTHKIIVSDKLIGDIKPNAYTLVTDALMPHTKSYSGIISEFEHTTSLDLSLLSPTKVSYFDIISALAKLKANWHRITCKSMTKIDATTNNYLINFSWDATSTTIEADKTKILQTLKSELLIESKS